jgi:FkbM family methyltransferase
MPPPPYLRIFALEPQIDAANIIRKLKIANCEVLELALGNKSEKRIFFTSGNSDSMASLYERHDTFIKDRKYMSTEVDVVRLDDFVKVKNIERIDFMKMDIEGAEFETLQGAVECMSSRVLKTFTFEFGTSNVNARVFFRDIFNLLSEHNYDVFRITPAGRQIRVAEYSEDIEYFARSTTYLAKLKDIQL